MSIPMTKLQAELQGFTVDTTCYPWLAYKGERFAPTHQADVMTAAEEALCGLLKEAIVAFKTQSKGWDIVSWMERAEAAAVGVEA